MGKTFKNLFAFATDVLETVVIALVIFLVVYIFLVQPHRVSGDSMVPNFENGELILTDKLSYKINETKRGDVIVFKAPPDKKRDFIKRIIGLPGETITISNGNILINDQILNENYLLSIKISEGSFLHEGEKKQLPANSYFVMGDNRSHSFDSREWGFVQKEDIVGRAWIVYWPISKASVIKGISYR